MNPVFQFLSTPRRLVLSVAGVWLLMLVGLLLWPTSLPTARTVKAASDHWQLQVPVTLNSDTALSVIQQRRLFAPPAIPGLPGLLPPGLPGVEEKPLTPPDWRLAGVYSEAGQLALLILTEGQPAPQTLRVGDSLPGGAKILAITSDRVTIALQGRRMYLSTYPQ